MHQSSDKPPDPEERQRSKPILITGLLSATSVLPWLAPALLAGVEGVPSGAHAIAAAVAITMTIAALFIGASYWIRCDRRAADRKLHRCCDELAEQHEELLRTAVNYHVETQRRLDALAELVRHVTDEVSRQKWNSYAEGVTDALGGEHVVDATTTRPINGLRVVPAARNHSRRS